MKKVWMIVTLLALGVVNAQARFVSVDPLAEKVPGWTPYQYAYNNPVRYVDPDGRFAIVDDFLVGLVTGLVKGEGFGGALSRGSRYAGNSAQIWSSFGRGGLGQFASKLTWQLPQQLAGVVAGHGANMMGMVQDVTHGYGATLIETNRGPWGGFTLGSVITAHIGTEVSTNSEDLFVHEYGHYLQSQKAGPAYLPAFAIPSGISAATSSFGEHEHFYTEKSADIIARHYFERLKEKMAREAEKKKKEEEKEKDKEEK